MSSIWTVRRSATDTKVAGVCGGIAQHWGVDPVLVRVGCALLALSGGIGVVLYIAGWLLIPVEGHAEARIQPLLSDRTRRWSREVWIVVVTLCCIATFTIFGALTPFGFGPAVILALIWYFGYYKNRPARHGSPSGSVSAAPYDGYDAGQQTTYQPQPRQGESAQTPPFEPQPYQAQPSGPQQTQPFPSYPGYPSQTTYLSQTTHPSQTTPFTHAAETWRMSVEQNSLAHFLSHPDPAGLYVDPIAAIPGTTVVKRARSTSARRLRLVSVLVLGLALSGLGAADALGVVIPLAAYFGVALLVLGLTLIAATWFGRARGILPVALLLVLPTVVTSFGGSVMHTDHWDTRQRAYHQTADLAAGDRLEAGDLKVDLSDLILTRDTTYTAHVQTGALEVSAPTNVNVRVRWRVGSGVFVQNNDVNGGSDLQKTIDLTPPDSKKPTLTLDLSVGHGLLKIR